MTSALDRLFHRAAPTLEGLPSRPRAALEVLFVCALVLATGIPSVIVPALLFAFGLALVRPWRRAHGGVLARASTFAALVVAIALPVAFGRADPRSPADRRLGIEIDPQDGAVVVRRVTSGAAAEGHLSEGDRIVGISGAPLDLRAPGEDLIKRLQTAPEDVVLDVSREAAARQVTIRVPLANPRAVTPWSRITQWAAKHFLLAVSARALALIAIVLLLLRANGQRLSNIGVVGKGAGIEALLGVPMAIGGFIVNVVAVMIITMLSVLRGSSALREEAASRSKVLLGLFGDESFIAVVLVMVVAATFEEVAFRGFLLPRLRHVTHSWLAAILIAGAIFGSGHGYEGFVAMFQTALLGIYLSAAFLARGRLVGPIVAHATFNTVALGLMHLLSRSGFVEKAQRMLEQTR